MTRVLLVEPGPDFSVADVADGWAAGFEENGCTVRRVPLGEYLGYFAAADAALGAKVDDWHDVADKVQPIIRCAAFEWWPDLVVIVSGFYVSAKTLNLLRERRMPTVMIFTESPYEDDDQAPLAAFVDAAIVNDPTNLDVFKGHNRHTYYLPHAWNPAKHYRRDVGPEYRSDVCFVGSAFPSRIELLEAVDWDGIDLALGGHWAPLADDSPLRKYLAHDIADCCPNDETVKLYSGTRASLNIYRREAQRPDLSDGWAMGPREVELAALGTFYLTEPRGENRERFGFVPTFDGPDDLSEKLRWWLAHDDARLDVARQAQAAVAGQTFAKHAASVLQATL